VSKLSLTDINDELIKPVVEQSDLDAADKYLADIVKSAELTMTDIPATLPYKVQRLLIAFVCYEKCKQKAGASEGAFVGQEATDKWTAKLKLFKDEMNDLEAKMSAKVLTGTTSPAPAAICSITLGRG